jgi:DNA-directed RNA polymerase specialized sigma subunit
MTWQIWLSKNYEILHMWSNRWHKEEGGELISLMSIYLEKNWSKFSMIPDGEQRIKFLQIWMKNNVKWSNSEFNNTIRVNNFEEIQFMQNIGDNQKTDDYLDILAESTSESLKAYIIDITNEFGEERARKIMAVRSVYDVLPTESKVLYDLYITRNMTIRSISTLLDIPASSVYTMIKDLKKEIRKKCAI